MFQQLDSCGFSFLTFQNIIWNEHIGKGASGDVYKCNYDNIDCIGKCFYLRDYNNQKGFINDVYSELYIYQFLKDIKSISEIIGYSYDSKDEYICILMKYYSSKSLQDYIQENNLLKDEKLLITNKLCECLKDIHSRNIVHCDIKPPNIIYNDKKKELLIIDFGASAKVNKNEKYVTTEENMGTEGYMSDELSLGEAYYKSDIYSFGVTILELWQKDIWDIKKDYRSDILFSLRKLKENNNYLFNILKKCLIKDVNKRIGLKTLSKYLSVMEI